MAEPAQRRRFSFARSSVPTLAVFASLAAILALAAACGEPTSTTAPAEAPPAIAEGLPEVAPAPEEVDEIEPTVAPASSPTATTAPEPTPSEPATRELRIITSQQLIFEPGNIDVEPGETVTFQIENPSAVFHTFTIAISTAKDEILVDVTVAPDAIETATVTFPEVPATPYLFCRPHEAAGMIGQVQVGGGGRGSFAAAER